MLTQHVLPRTEELVELGFFVGLTFGQQRWIKTLDIRHHEVLPGTGGGLADDARREPPRSENGAAPKTFVRSAGLSSRASARSSGWRPSRRP